MLWKSSCHIQFMHFCFLFKTLTYIGCPSFCNYCSSRLGPHHTRHFCARYCNKKWKKILQHLTNLRHRSQCPTKVSSYKNTAYLLLCFLKSLHWLVNRNLLTKIVIMTTWSGIPCSTKRQPIAINEWTTRFWQQDLRKCSCIKSN